ncbi:MAG: DUF6489 family protein [Solimonas sp.]
MQIKIEIDVRPEELRRFLGLPDVSALQEDVVAFLRDKVGAASSFDASQFVRSNFDVLRKTPAWKKFASRLHLNEDGEPQVDEHDDAAAAPSSRPRKAHARKRGSKKAAADDAPSEDGS